VDIDGRTPLHWAALSGSIVIARFLIDQKAEIDKPDNSGWTPLHIAVSAGHEDVVQELIGGGADVNGKNDKGMTALHYAASKSRIDIGRLLISRGADINARDKANQLPLHRAATTGSVGFVRLLIESSTPLNKLRLNTADRIGNTPLHLAMDSAHAEAAVLLINAGADRTRENLDGQTPENITGVGGQEQKLARQHVIDHCGKP
jgi:26S proteasome non-ATPase regulatory subunit 10